MDDVYCDICEDTITRYFRCTICQFNQFDLCSRCVKEGHWCLNRSHEIVEFEFQSGNRVEKGRQARPSNAKIPSSRHYMYEPLPAAGCATPYIRLLTVYPSKPDGALKADIRSCPLSEAPEFEALSYCWGAVQPIKFMQLNGKRSAITPNLFSAIRHVTVRRDEPLILWVDAVCINQGDNTEKAQQVALMRDIYERASRTIVWLGPDKDHLGRALTMCLRMLDLHGNTYFSKLLGEDHWKVLEEMLGKAPEDPSVVERRRKLYFRNIVKLWSDHGSNFSPTDLNTAAREVMHADVPAWIPQPGFEGHVGSFTDHLYASPPSPTRLKKKHIPQDLRLPGAMEIFTQSPEASNERPVRAELVAAQALFTGSWFNRIWIVQETIMAKEIIFQYGVNGVPGWAIYAGLKIACSFQPFLKSSLVNFTTVWSFRRALCRNPGHRHEKHKGMRDLISLLKTFRLRAATDSRDKIYALLGITSDDVNKLGITVRYDRSVRETYIETAVAIINSTQDLSVFELLKPKPVPTIPSWVPDWSDTTLLMVPLAGSPHRDAEQNTFVKPYSATGTSIASAHGTSMDGRLRLSGYICDIITETAVAMPDGDVELDALGQVNTPCRTETMYTKFVQMRRGLEQFRARLSIYQAWHKFACAKDNDEETPYPTGEDPMEIYKSTLQTSPSTPSHPSMEDFEAFGNTILKHGEMLDSLNSYPVDSIMRPNGTPKAALLEYVKLSKEYKKLPKPLQFSCTMGRRLVRTANGYLGLAPAETEVGDSVTLLKGAKTPVVIRERGEEWVVVGSAYVHGMMFGEVWDEEQCQTMVFV